MLCNTSSEMIRSTSFRDCILLEGTAKMNIRQKFWATRIPLNTMYLFNKFFLSRARLPLSMTLLAYWRWNCRDANILYSVLRVSLPCYYHEKAIIFTAGSLLSEKKSRKFPRNHVEYFSMQKSKLARKVRNVANRVRDARFCSSSFTVIMRQEASL